MKNTPCLIINLFNFMGRPKKYQTEEERKAANT